MYKNLLFGLRMLAVLGAGLVLGAPAMAQTPGRPPVTVVVFDDYPAFQPDAGKRDGRQAIPLRAIVFRRAPWDETRRIVILNPEHLDATTLAAALQSVRDLPDDRANAQRSFLVGLSAARPAPPAPPGAVPALNAKLAELRSQAPARIERLGVGRAVTIEDVDQYLAPRK